MVRPGRADLDRKDTDVSEAAYPPRRNCWVHRPSSLPLHVGDKTDGHHTQSKHQIIQLERENHTLTTCHLQEDKTGEIVFYMKGADIVMSSIVQYNDWLEEEVDNMAR